MKLYSGPEIDSQRQFPSPGNDGRGTGPIIDEVD